jgi:lysophospholipase L1-like esterase
MKTKIWQHLLLSIGSLLVFLLLFEVILRVAGFDLKSKERNPISNEGQAFVFNVELNYPKFFKRDKLLFWKFRPSQRIESDFMIDGVYEIDSSGLRDREFSKRKNENTIRIICMGNSCTFGWMIKQDQTYPKILERMLREKYPHLKVEVINAGITGYSSFQGKRFLQDNIIGLQPDIITIDFGWNDQWPAASNIEDKNQKLPNQWILDLQDLLLRTEVYKFMKYVVFEFMSHPKEKQVSITKSRVSLVDFRNNLEEMIGFCRSSNSKVILLASPIGHKEIYIENRQYKLVYEVHQAYNQVVRKVANEMQVPLVDIAKDFEDNPEYYDRGVFIHFNAKGSEAVAKNLFECLIALRMVL